LIAEVEAIVAEVGGGFFVCAEAFGEAGLDEAVADVAIEQLRIVADEFVELLLLIGGEIATAERGEQVVELLLAVGHQGSSPLIRRSMQRSRAWWMRSRVR